MKASEALRRLGIMRSGAMATTYKSGKDRPIELMMDGVFDAEKDLISTKKDKKQEISSDAPVQSKKSRPGWLKPVGITLLVFMALIVVLAMFGSPSAERVFSDSLDKMLRTDSMVVTHEITGESSNQESIKLKSSNYIAMSENETDDLTAKGKFNVDLTTQGVPITAEAEYIALNGSRYVKFSELSSTQPDTSSAFQQIEAKISGKWIKAREGDNFSNFSDITTDVLTTITALPYANLQDDTREKIVDILRDEDSFTIKESAEVTVDGQSAYRYELEYDRDNQLEVAKKLSDAVGYFQASKDDDESEIDKLELWIDINTSRFIKMEYSGTSNEGTIAAVITFSEYGELQDVARPNEYFLNALIAV